MNKVILMGRLTANPELKHTQSNLPVVNFTLAVNRPYVKQGQERQADFIDIVCWRSTAEFVARYFTKGQQVAVCGSLQVRNWQDQQGNKRRSYEVCRFQAGQWDLRPLCRRTGACRGSRRSVVACLQLSRRRF